MNRRLQQDDQYDDNESPSKLMVQTTLTYDHQALINLIPANFSNQKSEVSNKQLSIVNESMGEDMQSNDD
jgi:hypothetical protein